MPIDCSSLVWADAARALAEVHFDSKEKCTTIAGVGGVFAFFCDLVAVLIIVLLALITMGFFIPTLVKACQEEKIAERRLIALGQQLQIAAKGMVEEIDAIIAVLDGVPQNWRFFHMTRADQRTIRKNRALLQRHQQDSTPALNELNNHMVHLTQAPDLATAQDAYGYISGNHAQISQAYCAINNAARQRADEDQDRPLMFDVQMPEVFVRAMALRKKSFTSNFLGTAHPGWGGPGFDGHKLVVHEIERLLGQLERLLRHLGLQWKPPPGKREAIRGCICSLSVVSDSDFQPKGIRLKLQTAPDWWGVEVATYLPLPITRQPNQHPSQAGLFQQILNIYAEWYEEILNNTANSGWEAAVTKAMTPRVKAPILQLIR